MVAGASDGDTGGTWHAQLRGRSVVVRITGQGRFAVYERLPATFTVARHAEVFDGPSKCVHLPYLLSPPVPRLGHGA
jgi:hypothetical protein